jgi:hypothetical protein
VVREVSRMVAYTGMCNLVAIASRPMLTTLLIFAD